MSIKVGLVGNPNCGKTTLFNELTGSAQYVGNWPGVTVEKKEGTIKNDKKGDEIINLVDLPGIYSLSPYSPEEIITREYIIKEKPDVIINIVDATNIERNLYLTTQILEMGIPVVIALNMMDIIEKRGDEIDKELLSNFFDCPIIEISAVKAKGLKEVVKEIRKTAETKKVQRNLNVFSEKMENALLEIEKSIDIEQEKRWFATKIFEKDKKIWEQINIAEDKKQKINNVIKNLEEELDDESESIIINERYLYVTKIIEECLKRNVENKDTLSNKIDNILTNRFLALPIFAGIIFMIYFISVTTVGTMLTDWANDVFFGEYIVGITESILNMLNASEWVYSLVIDGIIGGVGAVLGFVPQMAIVFLFLSLLEDCGYMARVAFIMDKIFRKFGLSGKSFIPMLISTGCGVPAIMASRTIENEKDRKITIMVTTFIPCSAKLPIIATFVAALFPQNIFIGPSIYFLGMIVIVISGIILKKLKIFAGDVSPFVMELPQYHMPSLKTVTIHIWDRVKSFIIKAGTIIFAFSVITWVLSNFNFRLQMVDVEESILAIIGGFIAPIFAPLGFGDWRATVATLNGLVAKEQLVSTFGILLGLGEVELGDVGLTTQIGMLFTTVSAYSFVAFNMLCAPCFAAIGAIKREMGSWKWTLITIGFQTLVAYIVSFIIFNLGNLIVLKEGYSILGVGLSIILVIFTIYLIFKPDKHINK